MSSHPITHVTVEHTEDSCALKDRLACEALGLTIVEPEEGWESVPHDHNDDGREEVYLVLSGGITLTAGEESRRLEAGDAVRIEPEASRQLHDPDPDTMLVLASAPRDGDLNPEWNLQSFQG